MDLAKSLLVQKLIGVPTKMKLNIPQLTHTTLAYSGTRVATAQGKQGIWFLLFPDRENTGNFALTQGKILRHRENIFL